MPSATTRSVRIPSRNRFAATAVVANSRHAATGSGWSSLPAPVDEALVLVERHLGVLGRGLRRVRRQHPLQLAGGRALEVAVPGRLPRAPVAGLPGRIDVRAALRVLLGLDDDPGVRLLVDGDDGRVDPVELVVGALGEEELLLAGQPDARQRVPARPDHLALDLHEQRLREQRALDRHQLARLDVDRVADEHLREPLDPGVSHRGTSPPARRAPRRRRPPRPRAGRRSGPSGASSRSGRRARRSSSRARRASCRRSSRRRGCCG